MKISLTGVRAVRGSWALSAQGIFEEGVHLITGDVGSGKTTLALILAGLLLPESGGIVQKGIKTVMIAFQFPEFHVTGPDLESECRAWGVDPAGILAVTGLAGRERTNPLNLSRGELKRLILACVLAGEHDLLILDEPFSSLDCAEKDRLCSILSVRKQGITIIFTHERAHFPRVNRIWEIEEGVLYDRGLLPTALGFWNHAPALVKSLIAEGKIPANISRADLLEATCRT